MNKGLAFVALIFLIGGLGLGIVALATNSWEENGGSSLGFFQRCVKSATGEVFCTNNLDEFHRDTYKDDEWYLASVGSHCGAVFFGFVAMVLWFAVMCTKSTGIRGGAIICGILSFTGYLCCVIIWKFKYVEDHNDTNGTLEGWDEGYSFWLGVGAAAATGIAVILMIVAAVAHRRK